MMQTPVLKLTAGMIPFEICALEDAIMLLHKGVARALEETDRVVRSPSVEFRVPSILWVTSVHYVPRRHVRFSRLNVLYRDDQVCQYCGRGPLPVTRLQMDHVIPISRWAEQTRKRAMPYTLNSFQNCVAACERCNQLKANRLPHEAGLELRRKPEAPSYRPHLVISRQLAEKQGWTPFLEPFVPGWVKLH